MIANVKFFLTAVKKMFIIEIDKIKKEFRNE